jgi:hypothetical protein
MPDQLLDYQRPSGPKRTSTIQFLLHFALGCLLLQPLVYAIMFAACGTAVDSERSLVFGFMGNRYLIGWMRESKCPEIQVDNSGTIGLIIRGKYVRQWSFVHVWQGAWLDYKGGRRGTILYIAKWPVITFSAMPFVCYCIAVVRRRRRG